MNERRRTSRHSELGQTIKGGFHYVLCLARVHYDTLTRTPRTNLFLESIKILTKLHVAMLCWSKQFRGSQ